MADMRTPSALREFVKLRLEVEAVLQRVGLRTWDLVLIDADGNWIREEFGSEEAAEACARYLGIRVSRGWEDPRMARRMNKRDHWNRPGGQRRAV
jgi:hypothetical protein